MESSKRKSASGLDDDRAAKRRKPSAAYNPNDPDLMQGENRETTTHYGLKFLETLRRTSDKSGRLVAGYFEELLPRAGNEEYYKRVKMPISLQTIEQKLHNRDFQNMTELESYFKRMVVNVKEFYARNSQTFDDSERVRKAISNFMVKTNPAYRNVQGYSAQPTPIPTNMEQEPAPKAHPHLAAQANADAEADAEGEEDDAHEEDAQGEADEGNDEDAAGEKDDDAESDVGTGRIRIRRKAPRQQPNSSGAGTPQPSFVPTSTTPDHQFKGVPYSKLNFQQAQEKIVEEMIRKPDEEEDGYAYFDVFLNLPPRSLKDYYQVIKDPLCLKKLQKMVRGVQGRGKDISGVSEFKTWAAFEERAALIWQNALYYNEEGSDISILAKDLEKFFRRHFNEARAAVDEPQQTKIRVKKPEQPATSARPKKITIHVGRGSSASSPAPPTAGSASSDGVANSSTARTLFQPPAQPGHAQLDKTRSMSGSVASPSPSVGGLKAEEGARQSPAVSAMTPRPNGVGQHAVNGTSASTPGLPGAAPQGPYTTAQLTNGHAPVNVAPVPALPPHESRIRLPGRAPLLNKVTIRTHPAMVKDRRFQLNILPHPKETQQSVTVAIPTGNWKQQIIISMSPTIQEQGRHFKLFVICNGQMLGPAIPVPNDPIDAGAKLLEAQLHNGINTIQIQLIAALPKGEKLSNGSEVELEKLTVLANLMRH